MRGPTLQSLCTCQSREWTCRRQTRSGGDKGRWCYTGSSVKSSKMRKSRHLRKFQTMITYIMALFDNTATQRAPGQLQFNDCARPSSRDHCSLLSLFACQSDGRCRIDRKVALNQSVALSYANVLCARLFITWTTLVTPPTLPCTLCRRT